MEYQLRNIEHKYDPRDLHLHGLHGYFQIHVPNFGETESIFLFSFFYDWFTHFIPLNSYFLTLLETVVPIFSPKTTRLLLRLIHVEND